LTLFQSFISAKPALFLGDDLHAAHIRH